MITTSAVEDDLIEQFIETIEDHPRVVRAAVSHGRAVDVTVERDDDGNVPAPWRDMDAFDLNASEGWYEHEDFILQNLAGGGLTPGDRYRTRVGVSPYCDVCEDRPQKDDDGLCSSCSVKEGLLTGPAGSTAIVRAVHDDDGYGKMSDPGDLIRATANEDGTMQATLTYRGETRHNQPLNADAHKIVRWLDNVDTQTDD